MSFQKTNKIKTGDKVKIGDRIGEVISLEGVIIEEMPKLLSTAILLPEG